jgi:transposase-like protein
MEQDDVYETVQEWEQEVHDVYAEEFESVKAVARAFVEEGRMPAGMQAALEKTAAYMANVDIAYADLEERYGVGTSAIHNWVSEFQERSGVDITFNGYPDKLVETAAAEATQIMESRQIGKLAAAKAVADRYDLGPASIKQRINAESRSKFTQDGTTQAMYDCLRGRPMTAAALQDEHDLSTPPGNYLKRREDANNLSYALSPPNTERVSVWYRDGDRDAARALLAAGTARTANDPRDDFMGFLDTIVDVGQNHGLDIDRGWREQWVWKDAAMQSFKQTGPQTFARLERRFPPVRDYLFNYRDEHSTGERQYFFDADDVVQAVDAFNDTPGEKRSVASALFSLAERTGILDGFGGSPQKYDSRSIANIDVLAADALVERYAEYSGNYTDD